MACIIPTAAVIYFTRNMEKMYQSSAQLYTGIASGYSIESSEGQRIDYHVVNNAFDNLISLMKSRQTIEEVGLRLLSRHLMLAEPNNSLGKDAFLKLRTTYPQSERTWVDTTDFDLTLSRVFRRFYEGTDATIHSMILGDSGPYSVKTLSRVEAKRVKSSDMVMLSYQYPDPGIAKGSLVELLDVFVIRYKDLKTAETGNVVAYFEKRLAAIKTKLTMAEDKLTAFRSEHRVINYGEQTKAIAIKKQNAVEEYAKRKMNLQATEAALTKIEEKLQIRENILTRNARLLEKKQALTAITSQIAMNEAASNPQAIASMLNRQADLRQEINNDLHDLFNFSNSKEGLPSKQLLNDWLSYLIDSQKEAVQVKLFGKRLEDLNAEYDRFAPLGSTIDRYEREIGVFEREYLEVLHGLNMAKLKQQNIQLSSTLNVLDAPKYPTGPLASKRMLFVVVCFLAGFMGSVGIIIIQEMLDNTLRDPVHAERLTQLPVLGAVPAMIRRVTQSPEIKTRVLEQLIDRVNLQLRHVRNRPALVVLTSVATGTGKSTIAKWLVAQLRGRKINALNIEVRDDFDLSATLATATSEGRDLLLIEIPSLTWGAVNFDLVEHADLNVLVERADRSWGGAHKRIRQQLEIVLGDKPVHLLLNGMKFRFLEHVLGEVPGKTNRVKAMIKSILKFERANNAIDHGK